ncbi:hypothetical protein FOA52_010762 [Chlamydomonas sp. UWO 241]|nr:hypothetical protein FOA52_010762 [Chlamydomonas sp. UWO 241]
MGDSADAIPSPYDDDDDDDEEMKLDPSANHVVVIGAGPTGLLAALYLGRRGYRVDVYERAPAPGVLSGPGAVLRGHNYPIVLSSRALLAFRELGLQTRYNIGEQAVCHEGTWDVVAGTMEVSTPDDENARTIIVDRLGMVSELVGECRRLYANRITLHFDHELSDLDISRNNVSLMQNGTCTGGSMSVSAGRERTSGDSGCSLSASATRPGRATEAAGTTTIPDWDTAALEAAASARGVSVDEAKAPTRSVTAHYDLLLGCDGADSALRSLMTAAKAPKVRDFTVQAPSEDIASFVGFTGWIAAHVGELVPGFREHRPRQFLYVMDAGSGAPRLELWISSPGVLSGIVAWDGPKCEWTPDALCAALVAAYGSRVPGYCLDDLAARACARGAPPPQRYGRTVQVSQFHGPRMVLLGDAAHTMTNATRQGLNCAVEGVRLLNVVLKISGESVERAGNVLSEVRREDVQCLQMLELMQRAQSPGLKHGDMFFALAGWLAGLVWRCAYAMSAVVSLLLPGRVRSNWVVVAMRDCRQGYAEVLKVLTRYAAGPILAALFATACALREPLQELFRGAVA